MLIVAKTRKVSIMMFFWYLKWPCSWSLWPWEPAINTKDELLEGSHVLGPSATTLCILSTFGARWEPRTQWYQNERSAFRSWTTRSFFVSIEVYQVSVVRLGFPYILANNQPIIGLCKTCYAVFKWNSYYISRLNIPAFAKRKKKIQGIPI